MIDPAPRPSAATADRSAASDGAGAPGQRQAILIVDFGSQVTQLIARRVRAAGVYCEIVPFEKADEAYAALQPVGVILSGGPASVLDADAPAIAGELLAQITAGAQPTLGICYGQQTLVHQLGGTVVDHTDGATGREFGRAEVAVVDESPLTAGVWAEGTSHQVWMSHGDGIAALPDGFRVVGRSDGSPYAVIADDTRQVYAVQFHPEVIHTPDGAQLIENFVHGVCGCDGAWTMEAFRDAAIARIKAQVGSERVICGLSGGVDSAVAAVLIHEAIGDQLTCILVDHGLMRKNEAADVVRLFRDSYNIPLVHVEAASTFIGALEGERDPEVKRKTIGRLFVEVFEAEAGKLGGAAFLAQGTLYPDVVESTSVRGGPSQTIKSHHNVGGLPERMNLKLLEPLRELFKDEVRDLGRTLGLPGSFVNRHPFPGPGLAIRMPGVIDADRLDILREADAIFIEEIKAAGLYDHIWQAFAVLLPVRTVGVMGDARTYESVCALRAVTATDGMTAQSYPFEHAFLDRVATRIINAVPGINRVTYDVTSKPPGTIEWE
ncbi:MAG: glutamine-hydrolyzing GMP synthase [Pseudomonadota bacterium]